MFDPYDRNNLRNFPSNNNSTYSVSIGRPGQSNNNYSQNQFQSQFAPIQPDNQWNQIQQRHQNQYVPQPYIPQPGPNMRQQNQYVPQPYVPQPYVPQPSYNYNGYNNNLNQNYVVQNRQPHQMQKYMDDGTFSEQSISSGDFTNTQIATLPEKIPKQALMICQAQKKNLYDKDAFKEIQNDAINVINKTMAVSTFMFTFTDDIFMKVARPVSAVQCNQSVFNYPIANSRKNFTIAKVETNLKKLNTQCVQFKGHVLKSLTKGVTILNKGQIEGGVDDSDIEKLNLPIDTTKETLRFAARGSRFMLEVYAKAAKLLKQLEEDAGNRVYPSIEHHLYSGNYSDIFAFSVLRYLFKADTEKNITISKDRNVGAQLDKHSLEEVLPLNKTRKVASTKAYRGHGSKDPTAVLSSKEYAKLTSDDDITELEDMEDGYTYMKKVNKASSDHSKAVKPRFESKSEDGIHYDVFLRPTRGTKAMIVTEPNYFLYNLNYAVARGLSILMKCGIVPQKIITNVKICSLYTGAIYKLSPTKWSLSISPDQKLRSYCSLKSTEWSQYALFMDVQPISYQHEAARKTVLNWKENYKELFFNATSYKFRGENRKIGCGRNCGKLLESAFKNEALILLKQQLGNIQELDCRSPMEFTKSIKKEGMKHYQTIANKLATLWNTSTDTLSADIELETLKKLPSIPTFVYGQFGLTDDISFEYYCDSMNHKDKSILMTPDEYKEGAKNDLKSFPRLQIPLLYKRDSKDRTRLLMPKVQDLGDSEFTIDDAVKAVAGSKDYFKNSSVKPGEWKHIIAEILDTNAWNLGKFLISLNYPYLTQHFNKSPLPLNYKEYSKELSEAQINRIEKLNSAMAQVTDPVAKQHQYNVIDLIVMICRFIYGSGSFTDKDKMKADTKTISKYANMFMCDPDFIDYQEMNLSPEEISPIENKLGCFCKYLIHRAKDSLTVQNKIERIKKHFEDQKKDKKGAMKASNYVLKSITPNHDVSGIVATEIKDAVTNAEVAKFSAYNSLSELEFKSLDEDERKWYAGMVAYITAIQKEEKMQEEDYPTEYNDEEEDVVEDWF